MRKIKIFTESSTRVLSEQMNEWLAQRPAVIILNMLQSECYSFGGNCRVVTITIFYYEGEQGDGRA